MVEKKKQCYFMIAWAKMSRREYSAESNQKIPDSSWECWEEFWRVFALGYDIAGAKI